jgi:hypothetical protein
VTPEELEHALSIRDKHKRYEYVYDLICDYLDREFEKHNYCDFVDDKCIAVRSGMIDHLPHADDKIGCCFGYNIFRIKSDIAVCRFLGDRKCLTKCISCKLFTCVHLKEKGIRFDITDFPGIERIFGRKQLEVLQKNLFRSKEAILDKLQKVQKIILPFFLFRMLDLGSIG